MSSLENRRIWLVGGSEGIGLATAKQLLKADAYLVVSARNAETSKELLALQKSFPRQLTLLNLDVTCTESHKDITYQAWSIYGGLDSWFYNVGSYEPMPLQQWDFAKFQFMNSANYMGCVSLMCELKPYFIRQGFGEWIWNVSLASDFGLPYGGGYSAPKAALQNLAESLQPELNRKSIALKVINHGFVKTRLTDKNDFEMAGLLSTEEASARIIKVFDSAKFETRFPFGLAFFLGTMKRLPKSLALLITKRMLKDEH